MARPELRMSFTDAEALAREYESNLKHGRGFVQDAAGVDVLADCTLVLLHPASGRTLSLPAQAVMVLDSGPMRGVGLQLRPFDAAVGDRIERFVAGDAGAADPMQARAESVGDAIEAATDEPVGAADTDATSDKGEGEGDDQREGVSGEQRGDIHTQARIDILRKMSHAQRQKLANKGELQDRVILERLYGRDLWPQLLQNPKLTLPEVARIGRKRSVPQPLLTLIVDNNTWIQASVVRRALLSNPRVGHEAVDKLIRITPKHELKLMTSTLAYSGYVRDAARRALKKE